MVKKVIVIMLLFLISAVAMSLYEVGEAEKGVTSSAPATMTAKAELYQIILENENICLYALKEGGKELVKRRESSPLRENDRIILADGIFSDNLEEALMIMEDFIS